MSHHKHHKKTISKSKVFRQVHIYLSLFFLPCAFIFALTGIAYIFGFNQDVGLKKESFILDKPVEAGNERQALLDFLKEKGLEIPSNTEPIKTKSKGLTIGSAHYSVNIALNEQNQYIITTNTRSLLGDMIMLHKNKGAWYFSILSVGFGITLFLLYISGLIITFFASKKDRGIQFGTFFLGLIVTLILAYCSL